MDALHPHQLQLRLHLCSEPSSQTSPQLLPGSQFGNARTRCADLQDAHLLQELLPRCCVWDGHRHLPARRPHPLLPSPMTSGHLLRLMLTATGKCHLLPWGLSGEANLRGLASLTKTNTRRDASCAASPAQISYLASNEARSLRCCCNAHHVCCGDPVAPCAHLRPGAACTKLSGLHFLSLIICFRPSTSHKPLRLTLNSAKLLFPGARYQAVCVRWGGQQAREQAKVVSGTGQEQQVCMWKRLALRTGLSTPYWI